MLGGITTSPVERSQSGAKRCILVTGADGFVGSALVRSLQCRGSVRAISASSPSDFIETGPINSLTDWHEALDGVDAVIHTAARVHIIHDTVNDPLAAFRETNVAGTARLAEMAATAGVKRFVFLSSVKVNGESTVKGHPFTPDMIATPEDAYGLSKWEAEQRLLAIGSSSGMEMVIVRPPLVYGPGVKGNFLTLSKCIQKGIPLPFKSICNLRSMVGLDNLVDFIGHCTAHPGAAGKTFLVSDGEDHSTAEWIRFLGQGLGREPVLWRVPPKLLYLAAGVVGKRQAANSACASLQVSIENARSVLGWKPVYTIEEQMAKMAPAYYRNGHINAR